MVDHRLLEDSSIDDLFQNKALYRDDDEYGEQDYSVPGDYFTGATGEEPYHYLIRNALLATLCVVIAAVEAGLYCGLVSMDPTALEVRARTAKTAEERRRAEVMLSFVRRKHLGIVSIIVICVCANEALPVFLDRLFPAYVGVLLSTTLVVLVGEILPAGMFTGKNALRRTYRLLPVLRVTIFLTLCVSYPLAYFLDNHLHSDDDDDDEGGGERFNRKEISEYVRIKYREHQQKDAAKMQRDELKNGKRGSVISTSSRAEEQQDTLPELLMPEEGLNGLCGGCVQETENFFSCGTQCGPTPTSAVDLDDVANVEKILSFREKLVEDSFTPHDQVFAIPSSTIVDDSFVLEAYRRGFSRIPVYADDGSKANICGVLLTSHLLVVDKTAERRAGTMPLYRPLCCSPRTSIAELMECFRGGGNAHSLLAVVCANPRAANDALSRGDCIPAEANVRGIITFDDVVSSLFGHVQDEKSRRSNPSMERAKWAVGKWKCFVLTRRAQREQEASMAARDGRSRTVPHDDIKDADDVKDAFQYRALMDSFDSVAKDLPNVV